MEISYIASIIAKTLALVDNVLSGWTEDPQLIEGPCGTAKISVALNECGESFAQNMGHMFYNMVAFMNDMMHAMGAGSY